MRRWITYAAVGGFLLIGGVRGTCHERVRKPVVRFIDFYIAAQEAQKPPSLLERVAMGIAVVAAGDPKPQEDRTTSDQRPCQPGA